MKRELADAINRQIAGMTVLYEKLHHCHWFVKGPHFYTLHAKFEELYNEAAEAVDELAERLLAVGESPVSTLKRCLELSPVREADGGETAERMVEQLIGDYGVLRGELAAAIRLADEEGDAVTSDMLTSLAGRMDKHVWMLRAFLG